MNMIIIHRTPLLENIRHKSNIGKTFYKDVFTIGSIWHTNDGKCTILKNDDYMNLTIQFIDTGYEASVRVSDLMQGAVKDYLKPSVFGIGILGKDFKSVKRNNKDIFKKVYTEWQDMLRRCYYSQSSAYKIYGAKGVSVDARWLTFTNFFYDIQKLDNWDNSLFLNSLIFLDKDKYQPGVPINQKVYSRDTCCWLTREENNKLMDSEALKREFIVIYPDGHEEYCKGIREFANKHNMNFTNICACLKGTLKSYHKFKFKNIE